MKGTLMRVTRFSVGGLAAFFPFFAAASAVAATGPVTARLVADVSAVQPGAPFRLGVQLDIAEGWHIYDRAPGDTGYPTTVKFALPDGFRAGELNYPKARTYRDPGDIVSRGFEGRALLWTTVKAPSGLPVEGRLTLRGKVDWLSCKDVCVPGSKDVSLSLRVADGAAIPSAESRLFAAADPKKAAEGSGAGGIHGLGKAAPDFTLPDAKGKEYSLANYRGKHVVLEWTNQQCPFVKAHYNSGTMQRLAKEWTKKGIIWLTIDSSHFVTPESIGKWAKDKEIEHTVLLDPKGKVGRAYGAKTTPHMFIIDPGGHIAYQGAIDDNPLGKKKEASETTNYVSNALEALLSGKPVPVASAKSYGCSVKYEAAAKGKKKSR